MDLVCGNEKLNAVLSQCVKQGHGKCGRASMCACALCALSQTYTGELHHVCVCVVWSIYKLLFRSPLPRSECD